MGPPGSARARSASMAGASDFHHADNATILKCGERAGGRPLTPPRRRPTVPAPDVCGRQGMNDERATRRLFSTHWGTYRAEVSDGRLRGVRAWEGDPDPAEFGEGMADMLDHPARIARPMVRRGFLERGARS